MHNEIISQLEAALGNTITLLESFTEIELNTVPFEGRWTAGQVGRHIFKVINGMDQLLYTPTERVDRDPEERAAGIRDLFLDFSTKMKSPDFIIPEDKQYDKQELIKSLQEANAKMTKAAKNSDLTQLAPLPEGNPLVGNSKLEIVHFVTYHTIRHNHQIEKISVAV
ncbi:hypothetical protein HYN59_07745 [Flavobacterium album]|uniref:DinB-like domain-containing protein n=1 Tax=Flavobacterium album TaxID=2175091 RepID=A0A2S1QXB3_9FLAO|nr:DinB family protein [Flavobacterium album]AWH85024.1 hypothetical protein HYN59_07745 [Flavobacterium album]